MYRAFSLFLQTLGPEHVDTAEHRQLALEAAQQMIILLKNDGGMLPIDPSKVKCSYFALIFHKEALYSAMQSYRWIRKLFWAR